MSDEDRNTVTVYASDDLMTRAEKIVHIMGYRGATAGFAINIYRLLQAYEKADAEERSKLGASP